MSTAPATTPPPDATLGHSAIAGVVWTALQRWVTRLTGFATVVLLTHLLAPADFGTVAVALSVLPLIYLLVDMGFGTYLVQADDADEALVSTVFWYALAAGILLAGGLAAAAPLIAGSLHVPQAAGILYGLVPLVVISSVGGVPNALLRRKMRFRALAVQAIAAALISQVVTVTLALLGAGAWALVAQVMTAQTIATVFAWVAAGWRPRPLFRPEELRRIAGFGINVFGVEIVALARTWGENLLIVTTLGVSGLGYLNVAQRLIQAAQDLSSAAILPVSTVFFAKVRESGERLRAGYLRALGLTYAAVVPVMVMLVVGAPRVVPVVFGHQWGHSVVPVEALAVAGVLTVAATLDQTLFYGSGRPGRWLGYAVVIDALTVATTAALVHRGLVATSLGFVGVAAVATAWRWRLVGSLLGISARAVARPFGHVAVAALVSGAAGTLTASATAGLSPVASIALIAVVVLVVHASVVRLVLAEEYAELLHLARRLTGRWAHVGGVRRA